MPFRFPPLTLRARRRYLLALAAKHRAPGQRTDRLAIVQELEGILLAQMDKASGLLGFHGVAVAIVALDTPLLPRSPVALGLLIVSTLLSLFCCFSIWPSSEEASKPRREARHLLDLLVLRSACINGAVGCSLLAILIMIVLGPRPVPAPVTPMTFVAEIGPFCRGGHDALCPLPRDSASAWAAPVTPARFLDSLRTLMAARTATRITIVGSADRTELRARMRERYGDNQNLARSRAEWVREGLRRGWPDASTPPSPLVLTRGAAVLDTALAQTQGDRGVLIEVELRTKP